MTFDELRKTLIKRRHSLKLSQDAVATAVGVSKRIFGEWERGTTMPGAHNFLLWADYVGVDLIPHLRDT